MKKLLLLLCLTFGLVAQTGPGASLRGTLPRIGTWSSRIDLAATNASIRAIADFTPYTTITIVRFQVFANTQAVTCATAPVLSVRDTTASSNLTSITITNATSSFDSGAIAVAVPAGDVINLQWTTAAAGCGTTPAGISFTVQYR